MAVHRRRPPSLGDQGADVFDLALDGVRGGVATIAPAIVVEDCEMLRQLLGGRAHQSPVAHRSTHQDDRRTIAQPVEGDGGAVGRSDLPERFAHRRPPSRITASSFSASAGGTPLPTGARATDYPRAEPLRTPGLRVPAIPNVRRARPSGPYGAKRPLAPAFDFGIQGHRVPVFGTVPADPVLVVLCGNLRRATRSGEVDQVYVLVPWTDILQLHPGGAVELDGVIDVFAPLPHQLDLDAGLHEDRDREVPACLLRTHKVAGYIRVGTRDHSRAVRRCIE